MRGVDMSAPYATPADVLMGAVLVGGVQLLVAAFLARRRTR